MEASIRALTEQIKVLSSQASQNRTPGATTPQFYARGSPVAAPVQAHLRQQGPPMPPPAAPTWQSGPSSVPRTDMNPFSVSNQGMMYPMQTLPPPTPQQEEENWELLFINAMSGAPGASLEDLLDHCPLDKILPLQGPPLIPASLMLGLLAQVLSLCRFPVHSILTHVPQLSTRVASGDQTEDAGTCLWWLLRCAQVIDTTVSLPISHPRCFRGPHV
jgi:hypothetical protein